MTVEEETISHIRLVQYYLVQSADLLHARALAHDASKLQPPEREGFEEYAHKLKDLTYGSEEYKQALKEMKPFLDHHYQHNDHHPEYYPNGIQGMSLLSLLEMLCDWAAAGKRHASNPGDIVRSIEINQQRFEYSDELKQILLNTVIELEIGKTND